jgi:hypothetical protein
MEETVVQKTQTTTKNVVGVPPSTTPDTVETTKIVQTKTPAQVIVDSSTLAGASTTTVTRTVEPVQPPARVTTVVVSPPRVVKASTVTVVTPPQT